MDQLLSVSQAARMVGVPRGIMQQHIQEGQVSTFEGYIRMSELHKAYPEIAAKGSAMLEKVRQIQDAATRKDPGNAKADPERLAVELHRAGLEITRLQAKIESYRQLASEAEGRLVRLQAECDHRQAAVLGTYIGWYMSQNKLRY